MSRVRAWSVVALSVALLGGTAACGAADPGGDPTAGCGDETRTAGEPGAADPMLVLGAGTYAPTIVYADGAVVIPTASLNAAAADAAAGHLQLPMMAPGFSGDQPGGFTAGWLSECELAAVIEAAEPLFEPGVDFGTPQITDHASTPFSLDGTEISLYAFDRDDPGGGVHGAQARARQDLADLWALVEDAARLTGEVAIERVFVHTYGSIDDGEVTGWPLATPVSEIPRYGCLTVRDPVEVEAMLAWLDSPDTAHLGWRLAVVAAAPGVPDCAG